MHIKGASERSGCIMKTKLRMVAAVLCISALLSVFSCSSPDPMPKNRVFYDYFDTITTVYDYTGCSEEDFSRLAARVEGELSEYHRLYDIYNEYEGITNLATLNRTAGRGPQKVDSKIIKMLLFSKEMYNLTGGKVNIAMGSVTKIWHDYRTEGVSVPPMDMLRVAAEHTDIENLVIDEENMTVELKDAGMRLDVGAIAKGYAVEMIASSLLDDRYTGYILDVGGNIRAVGQKPSGAGWTCGVRNPNTSSTQTYVYKSELKNSAMSTSGVYERFYTVDGINYHHIISSDTLMPENRYLSVSIRANSSALSDALSTAVFNMPPDEAKSFVNGLTGVLAVLVMSSGEVVTVGE